MLNWPSSVWNAGSAIAASASAFFSAGSPCSSTRLSSTSSPVIGSSVSNCVLAEHPLEHVEAAVDLLAIARAVGPRELLCVDVLPHAVTLGAPRRPWEAPKVRLRRCHVGPGPVARRPPPPMRRAARPAPGTRPGTRPSRWSGSTSKHRSSAHHASAPSPACQAQNAVTAAVSGTCGSGAPRSSATQTRRWSCSGLAGHGVQRRVADLDPGDRPEHTRRPVVVGQLAPLRPSRRRVAARRDVARPGLRQRRDQPQPTATAARRTGATVARSSSRLACVTRPANTACAVNGWCASSYGTSGGSVRAGPERHAAPASVVGTQHVDDADALGDEGRHQRRGEPAATAASPE